MLIRKMDKEHEQVTHRKKYKLLIKIISDNQPFNN